MPLLDANKESAKNMLFVSIEKNSYIWQPWKVTSMGLSERHFFVLLVLLIHFHDFSLHTWVAMIKKEFSKINLWPLMHADTNALLKIFNIIQLKRLDYFELKFS